MIVTLTPNPSLDRTVTLPGPLLRGAVNRLGSVTVEPGGKGVNVARVLAASGQEATALVPAASDDPLLKAIDSLGLKGMTCRAVPVAGAARINTAVTEPDGTTTKLNEPGAGLDDDEIAEVRLDVTLEAAEPGLRITTATAHLLGALRWLGRAEAALVLAGGSAACHCPITGENPLVGLADLACAPGGRLGVIETERVMVHDAMGVSGHSIEQVLSLGEGAPVLLWSSFDALSAHEEVSELGDAALDILCTAVGKGAVAGIVCSHRPAAGLCPSLWGRVLCVDVAPDAVTLMRLSRTCIDTLQV